MRRFFLVSILAFGVCGACCAQKNPCAIAGQNNAFLGIQTIRLWAGPAPQAKGEACQDIPTLTITR